MELVFHSDSDNSKAHKVPSTWKLKKIKPTSFCKCRLQSWKCCVKEAGLLTFTWFSICICTDDFKSSCMTNVLKCQPPHWAFCIAGHLLAHFAASTPVACFRMQLSALLLFLKTGCPAPAPRSVCAGGESCHRHTAEPFPWVNWEQIREAISFQDCKIRFLPLSLPS